MTACELVSEGSKRERQRDEWLRPAAGGDIIADSRQCESKAGVTTVSPLAEGGGQKATHLISDEQRTAEPNSSLAVSISLLSASSRVNVLKISPFCLWFQVAGEHKYHPECFVCLSCKVVIEDRDTYALVERSKLYW